MITNKVKYYPIKILLTFLIFTEVFFFIGPIDYSIDNNFILILFFIVINLSLYYGYKFGINKTGYEGSFNLMFFVKTLLILSIPVAMLQLYWSIGSLSIIQLMVNVSKGIMNSGDVYYSNQEISSSGVNLPKYILSSFLSPIVFVSMVLGVYFFKKLPKTYGFILLSLFILEASKWLSIGTRKGLIDLIIILFATVIASNINFIQDKKLNRRIKMYLIIFISLFIVYFSISNLSRYSQYDSFADMQSSYNIKEEYQFLPSFIVMPLYSTQGYLCQGYYALALALDVGYVTPNLLATNFFTINVAEKFGMDVGIDETFLGVLESRHGIHHLVNWHSIYVWLANGFTFLGVPIFIFYIGYLFSRTWIDSILKRNIMAIPLFVILFQMIFYFFANNQIFSFSFPLFVILFISYKLCKLKR